MRIPLSEPASHAAASFRLLAAVLRQSRRDRAKRHSFQRDVWIAPIVGETLPLPDEFERVTACDLSTGGLSFLSPRFVRDAELVVSFGPPGHAPLVHTALVVWQSQVAEDGPGRVKVGCRFRKRVTGLARPDGAG